MQRRLLGEADLTLTKAMELAQGMEAAERNARSFKATEPAIRKIRGKPFQRPKPSLSCSRCGKSNHTPQECRFKDAECHACGKKGHIAPACRSKPQGFHCKQPQFGGRNQFKARQGTHQVHTDETVADSDTSSNEFRLFKLQEPTSHPISIQVRINNEELLMEVDTGAAVSIISDSTRRKLFPLLKLHKSQLILKTYTNEQMQCPSTVRRTNHTVSIGRGGWQWPSLFGRNWLKYIQLDWGRIASVQHKPNSLQTLLQKHKSLFNEELGTVKPYRATLHIKPDATPKIFKPCSVPFAINRVSSRKLTTASGLLLLLLFPRKTVNSEFVETTRLPLTNCWKSINILFPRLKNC